MPRSPVKSSRRQTRACTGGRRGRSARFGGGDPDSADGSRVLCSSKPVVVPGGDVTSDPYQFQWWALGLVGARPAEGKKGADQGIDGRIYFHDGDAGKTKQIVLSVKAGKLHAPYVRDLRGVVEREQAALGVLLTLHTPTTAMRTEAASAGFYASPWGQHPRVQILTVGELLEGKKLDAPPPRQTNRTYRRAPKALTEAGEQPGMFGDG